MEKALPPENPWGHTKKLRYFLQQIDRLHKQLGAPVRVLDFGCGNGTAVSQFIIQDCVDYFGVDFHKPSLDYARAHFESPKAQFASVIPAQRQFDLVLYSDVLEHLEEPGTLLREHRQFLAQGGLIALSVPNGYGPFEIESWGYRRLQADAVRSAVLATAAFLKRTIDSHRLESPAVPYNRESGHVQFFTQRSLDRLLSDNGFAAIDRAQGAFFGGSFSARILNLSAFLIRMNAELGSVLPAWAVSSWYVTAKRVDGVAPATPT
jgi:2-polyprenyl-3-methyl-5-hydroxy-6-metoxy-1,4-benzoquinol methylase